jgi:hypothetical protein
MFRNSILLSASLVVCLNSMAHASQLVGYTFNDPSPLASSGSAVGVPALSIASPAILGASGSGVSGLVGDRALDNRAATSMGGTTNSSGGEALHAADFNGIDALLKFTISGWFKVDSTNPVGGNAMLFANRSGASGVSLFGDPNVNGNLVLAVDNGSNSSAGFGLTGAWVNYAVTYDGTILQPGPNVFFYAGGVGTPLALVGSGTNANGSGNDPASDESVPLTLGARILFGSVDADPFDGLLDNTRLFDEIVPLSTLQALRIADTGVVPEPAILASTIAAGVVLLRRR